VGESACVGERVVRITMPSMLLARAQQLPYRNTHTIPSHRQAKNMDSNAETMISNAYYCVKPVARAARVQKEHPLLYRWLRCRLHGTARRGTARCDTARCDTARCGTARCDTARCDTARCDTARCDTARCDTARCDTARHDTARCGTARHGAGAAPSTHVLRCHVPVGSGILVLPRTATCCHVLPRAATRCHALPRAATCCHALSRAATCCHVLPRAATCCHVLPCAATCCHRSCALLSAHFCPALVCACV
jgi:hypothetical protein